MMIIKHWTSDTDVALLWNDVGRDWNIYIKELWIQEITSLLLGHELRLHGWKEEWKSQNKEEEP